MLLSRSYARNRESVLCRLGFPLRFRLLNAKAVSFLLALLEWRICIVRLGATNPSVTTKFEAGLGSRGQTCSHGSKRQSPPLGTKAPQLG